MKAAFFTIFLVFAVPCFPGEFRWYDNFFIEGSFHQYFSPEILSEHVNPNPGFRGAFGYEYSHFRLAVESGYSTFEGTNPLVIDISIIPLALKFGYEYPIYYGFGVQGDLLAGYIFSHTNRYKNIMNMLQEQLQEDNKSSLFTGARVYGTWTVPKNLLPGNCVKVYAGGGIDIINETDGPIPITLLEFGLSFKPFALAKSLILPKTPKEEKMLSTDTSKNYVIEKTKEGKVVRLLNAVYFEADSDVMIEKYRPIIDAAGERLKADPSLRINLRAYAAPLGTVEGQTKVSAARANFCSDYLNKKYGIAKSRMHVEYYGAEKTPELFKDSSWESYRCVELIIEEK
jgi:flagellar motor protein MotB